MTSAHSPTVRRRRLALELRRLPEAARLTCEEVDPRVDPDVVDLDDLTSALYVEDVDEVDRYNVFFNHLRATALSFDATAH